MGFPFGTARRIVNDSSGYGLFLRNAPFAVVNDNTMLRNGVIGQTDVDASGIGVAQGSMVRASGNQIADNANTGIEVFDNSTVRSERDTIAVRTANPPGRTAVDTFRAGLVDLRGVTLTGRVFVNQQSQLQARNLPDAPSTIAGNIQVNTLGLLRLRAGVVGPATTVTCGGPFTVCTCDGLPSCPAPAP